MKKTKRVSGVETVVESFSVDAWERMDIYKQEWSKIEAKLMHRTSALFHKYVEKLYDFISRYSTGEQTQLQNDYVIGFNFGLLPTAMIALSEFF